MSHVISVGGKNYLVWPGQTLLVDRLSQPAGEKLTLADLVGSKKVTATLVGHRLGRKIRVQHFRPKTRHSRLHGHRQKQTILAIDS